MAVGPCAPASLAATAIASTLARECRTPRALRYSGTSRKYSNKLRKRPDEGNAGSVA